MEMKRTMMRSGAIPGLDDETPLVMDDLQPEAEGEAWLGGGAAPTRTISRATSSSRTTRSFGVKVRTGASFASVTRT
jgi:hypothetical protein